VSAPLLSQSWYRVAGLKPRLRMHARLHRHLYRGEVWYLLQDPASSRIHRFGPGARLIIAAMDGERSVEQLWELANRRLGENAPSQDEVINLLGQLHVADLLQTDVTPDVAELFERGEKQDKQRRRRSYANPMAIRIPLWDPDAFLNAVRPLLRLGWSRWGALAWLAVVAPALVLAVFHWHDLTHNFSDRVLALDNLLSVAIVFPMIKALHELGHAAATKAGGGEVHDMGIIILVLLPVPYVEASAANVFRSKYRRAMVGAAGMAVELFVAACAFYVWMLAEPGFVRALMFNVILIASVSTLLFNGNPLLRYDAYYMLADMIEMPNLAQRSLRYWGYLFERYLFGVSDAQSPPGTAAEKAWMLFYGGASTAYRVLLTIVIALFIAGKFFVIGVLLAAWAVVAMAVVPVAKGIRHIVSSERLRRNRTRAVAASAGLVAALLAFAFLVPVPHRTQAEGVIWMSEQSIVRARADCFFERFIARPGSRVAAGDPLISCSNPAQDAAIRLGEARVQELEAEYAAEFVADRAGAEVTRQRLLAERAALERARERAADLVVDSSADGVFTVPMAPDMPGRWLRKGSRVGYVVDRTRPVVRVVVGQGAADLVRLSTERVDVRLAHRPEATSAGRIVRHVPAGEDQLPSPALAQSGGGRISVDPRDANGARTLEKMFQLDIELPAVEPLQLYGQRVHVRFDHPMEPLAAQLYRSVRQLFLSRFEV
jgi:putative peptide zinc metalloprotease protein